MEDFEENEEKVNLTDLLFPVNHEEKYAALCNDNLQNLPSSSESYMLPVPIECVKKEPTIENKYQLKELSVVLDRLILPNVQIKNEPNDDEQDTKTEDNSWLDKEYQELTGFLSGDFKVKDEPLSNEESYSNEAIDEDAWEDCETNVNENDEQKDHRINGSETQTPIQKENLNEVNELETLQNEDNRCISCNYAFGVTSSWDDHKNKCKPSESICRSILDSIIVAAIPEKRTRSSKARDEAPLRFICCEITFTKFTKFNSHKASKHNITYLICGLCSYEVDTSQNLYNHYKERHFPEANIFFDEEIDIGDLTKIDSTSPLLTMNSLKCPKSTKLIPQPNRARHLKICDEKKIIGLRRACPSCDTLITVTHMNRHLRKCDPAVLNRKNEEECTAAQQGILCQCSTCAKILSESNKNSKTMVLKPHVCSVCNFGFFKKCQLKQHMETHLGLEYPCNICAKLLKSKRSLDGHMLTQHSSEGSPFRVSCNICHKEFSRKTCLKLHIRSIHLKQIPKFKVPCPHCPKMLSCQKALAAHIKNHLKDEEYICDYCNRVYYAKETLIAHIKSQHLPKVYIKCKLCEYVGTNKVTLYVHKVKKHTDKKYNCEFCGKCFPFKDTLEVHKVTHSEERPFLCKVCGKGFKRDINLRQHQYTHSSERPHLCSICGQSFQLKTHLKQHMAVHGIGNNHKCIICNQFFARKRELNSHMAGHNIS